ncbi:pre-60S factor rei1 [Sorochytrium milnesiophthora]
MPADTHNAVTSSTAQEQVDSLAGTPELDSALRMTIAWCKYNAKRKLARLPPISKDAFIQLQAGSDGSHAQKGQATFSHKSSFNCDICSREYQSQTALDQHLATKKHQQRWRKSQNALRNQGIVLVDLPVSSSDKDEQPLATATALADQPSSSPTYSHNGCLFCSHQDEDIASAVEHMQRVHSFFIPDIEYLADLPGLLAYLGDKIYAHHTCIKCVSDYTYDAPQETTAGVFQSLKACWAHMAGKGHCGILYENGAEREVQQFYDFGIAADDDACSDASYELVHTHEDGHQSVILGAVVQQHALPRGAYAAANSEANELVLPSGHRLGHRSYSQYYRQRIRPQSASPATSPSSIDKAMRLLGASGHRRHGPMSDALISPDVLQLLSQTHAHLSPVVRKFLHDMDISKPLPATPEQLMQLVHQSAQQATLSQNKKQYDRTSIERNANRFDRRRVNQEYVMLK